MIKMAQETLLEIDLPALKSNFEYLRSKIKPSTKFMAVVKAYAYGSDASQIAGYLEKLDVDYFAVAYTEEGIALRKAGITKPILVLHPLPVHFKEIITYKLEPSLYSFKTLNDFLKAAENEKQYPVHLKFNSGLNRLGFKKQDADKIITLLNNSESVSVTSVFSHLMASEDSNEKDFTLQQINIFKEISIKLIDKLKNKPLLHILNTSGILNYADIAQFDMVRSGIGLYGFGNDEKYNPFLKPVVSLKSVISQIHEIEKGESVGYNRGFVAKSSMRTATVPLGHADGIGRQYGQGKSFLTVHGQKCPIVGNVCMDMLMIDVTNVACEEGDEILVFGQNPTASEFASWAGTISYELISAISQRVKREIIF
ncbi:alanine racemase [Galbibacter sp. EGI 63066]|uniref:alanine racemase n=1 Tax=Galbibacter sp. EGI 63066 TaxID=2993559 RepID=UPI0022496E4E|nr:alanine racemase [Galbibacter sp. EGI 63066]MCX2678960.1 alanine racemase [Galbibacter sp. EGI 63066]